MHARTVFLIIFLVVFLDSCERRMEERLVEKEAYDFLHTVRRVFQDERKFRELLCILKDYPSKR